MLPNPVEFAALANREEPPRILDLLEVENVLWTVATAVETADENPMLLLLLLLLLPTNRGDRQAPARNGEGEEVVTGVMRMLLAAANHHHPPPRPIPRNPPE